MKVLILSVLILSSCEVTRDINGVEVPVKSDKNTPEILANCINVLNNHTNKQVLQKCTIDEAICFITYQGLSCIERK